MSWLSKIIPSSVKKVVTAATAVVPGLTLVAPIGGTEQVTNSVKGLLTGAAIATTAVAVPQALSAVGVTGSAATTASTSSLVKTGVSAAVKSVTDAVKTSTAQPAASGAASQVTSSTTSTPDAGTTLLLFAAAAIAIKLLFFRR